jgi:hypothetical protein
MKSENTQQDRPKLPPDLERRQNAIHNRNITIGRDHNGDIITNIFFVIKNTFNSINIDSVSAFLIPSLIGGFCYVLRDIPTPPASPLAIGQSSTSPPNITQWILNNGLDDSENKTSAGIIMTALSGQNRISPRLDVASSLNRTPIQITPFYLPETNYGKLIAGEYQGRIEPEISSFIKRREREDFDTTLKKVADIQRITSGIVATDNHFIPSLINPGKASQRYKRNANQLPLVPVPTPALLPGMVAFGLGLVRKRKQECVG